jgi:hypothetical protein
MGCGAAHGRRRRGAHGRGAESVRRPAVKHLVPAAARGGDDGVRRGRNAQKNRGLEALVLRQYKT